MVTNNLRNLTKLGNLDLLKQLCMIHATSGNETAMKQFLLDYVEKHQHQWKTQPIIHQNKALQDNLILEFGKPRTAVFAHMDSVGFTVGYQNQLIPIGSPVINGTATLVGRDHMGPIICKVLPGEEGGFIYDFGRAIARGTDLVFQCDFVEEEEYVQSCYLDNRLGLWVSLELAAKLDHGLIVFSCREEHGGGAIPVLAKYIWEQFRVQQTLIADITWVTSGIAHGLGVAISLRDAGIPRKQYVSKILKLAEESGIDFQLEVESSGSSDARELQASPYPFDWCFMGAAESGVHSPQEKVHKYDIQSMITMYQYLMAHL